MDSPLLELHHHVSTNRKIFLYFLLLFVASNVIGLAVRGGINFGILKGAERYNDGKTDNKGQVIESEIGVVATDDVRCSAVGVSMLKIGGHAVDAAVAAALCIGVVLQASSGIGGGSFMVVKSSSSSNAQAFDMRETAPIAASQNMYQDNPEAKYLGALSMGVPGELAGLHAAWLKYGRLPWKTLFQPAIELAKNGFVVSPALRNFIASSENKIMSDPGLRNIYAPNGVLLREGEICRNAELGQTLEIVAEEGIRTFYNGTIDAMVVNVMGYTIYGMPPPSSGTLGLSLVLNILDSYGSLDAAKGNLDYPAPDT
ncbi:unnamed protein product [Vicia faba]|uniref:Uncharacterized protein n=1 Tax=Vicia faba TaxID=3906 RepID=A0AAV0ZA37_VICFA|nr:unnamed protein product [Vicia faba]